MAVLENAERNRTFQFGVGLTLQNIASRTEIFQTNITPSTGCKSSGHHKSHFVQILEALRLPSTIMLKETFSVSVPPNFPPCQYQPFLFSWSGEGDLKIKESKSYAPLEQYVTTATNSSVKIIADGSGLPHGLLFDVRLHTLRPTVGVRCNELRKQAIEPRHIFNLSGRSDLVVLKADSPMTRTTVSYCIEVKTVDGMANENECLREAFLQLVGLNAYNPYTSPAVILTNLNRKHYILYLDIESRTHGDVLQYQLIIHSMQSFADALWFAETQLSGRQPVTQDLFRQSSATSSATKAQGDDESEEKSAGNVKISGPS